MSHSTNFPHAVVVTGASTGIGEACALELDRCGYHVFAGVRSDEAARQLQTKASKRLTPVMLDVTDAAAIASAAQRIHDSLREKNVVGLAGLVNNAGIVVSGPLEFVPLDDLRRQIEVNVIGQVAVTQAMLPMLRAARGRIVNIGSISGLMTAPYIGPYSLSKFALEAVTNALRLELRHSGIQVSILEPGNVATPIWDKSIANAKAKAERASPEADRLYRAEMEQMERVVLKARDTAMPVEQVVRAVLHALNAPRPKTRYPVGSEARLLSFFFRFFPDRLRDAIILRSMGLK